MKSVIAIVLMSLSLSFCQAAKTRFDSIHLWGVNFQPCLSWEYNSRLKKMDVGLSDLHQVIDNNLEDLEKLKVNMIRCHLTPADFTDRTGNLVETPFLDALDYMIAKADEKGIKTTLAFINHMGNGYVDDSFMNGVKREDWIHIESVRSCSQNYITQLLNRNNKYRAKKYAKDEAIAYWELINEPAVYTWDDIQRKANAAAWADFNQWVAKNKLNTDEQTYLRYRAALVQSFIDGLYRLIRKNGSKHPIVWSHNWHRYRNGNVDVFNAALVSKADAVACCNYPGQDFVPEDYWNAPIDMAPRDFAPWFNQYYDDVNGYGWMRLPEYAKKGKVVYEFETFFNQSSYLYPIQALYFRALGVQSASMWTYCMQEYAQYHAGSHFLSLTCTPSKSVSFIIARQIFDNTPLGTVYDRSINEIVSDKYAISKARDLAVWSDADRLYYTRDIRGNCPLRISSKLKEIIGLGSSDVVSYTGTGIYFININEDSIRLEIMPDHHWIQEPWNSKAHGKVSEIDYTKVNTLSLYLNGWDKGDYTLWAIDGDNKKELKTISSLDDIALTPGEYLITRIYQNSII